MAITPVERPASRTRPLPAAKLYLEDVEEIADALRNGLPDYERERAQTSFSTSRFRCDSIEELARLPTRRVSKLEVRVGSGSVDLAKDRACYSPPWDGPNSETLGRLVQIFDRRRVFCGPLRGHMLGVALFTALCAAGSITLLATLASPLVTAEALGLLGPAAVLAWLAEKLLRGVGFTYSSVCLWRSHEPTPEAARWLPPGRVLVATAVIAAVTGAVGAVVGWLFGRAR